MEEIFGKYINYCKANGALDALIFKRQDIVYDERVLLKCAFGCKDWGLSHTCPSAPKFLGLDLYKRIFQRYEGGILIHCADKKTSQTLSFKIESWAFCDGYYWAFSLSDCGLCESGCMAKLNKPCANPKRARPAFHSVGIDVFATARGFNLPIKTLADEGEEQNWYSAVFIE